jgi:hypothetical protein
MKRPRMPRVLTFAMTVCLGMKNHLSQTLTVNTELHNRPVVLDSPVDIAKQ